MLPQLGKLPLPGGSEAPVSIHPRQYQNSASPPEPVTIRSTETFAPVSKTELSVPDPTCLKTEFSGFQLAHNETSQPADFKAACGVSEPAVYETEIFFLLEFISGEIISGFLQPANDKTQFNVFAPAEDKTMSHRHCFNDKQEKIAAKPGCLKTKQGGVVTTKRSDFTAEQAIPELFHHLGSRM